MKTMSSKNIAWSLGLAFALFITGLASAFYTGRLAIVSAQSYTFTSTRPSGTNVTLAECTRIAYRTYGSEVVVIVGQSMSSSYETTSGGAIIQHADLSFGGAPTTAPSVHQWGNISHRGYTSYLDSYELNWVSSGCMNRPFKTS